MVQSSLLVQVFVDHQKRLRISFGRRTEVTESTGRPIVSNLEVIDVMIFPGRLVLLVLTLIRVGCRKLFLVEAFGRCAVIGVVQSLARFEIVYAKCILRVAIVSRLRNVFLF